MADAAGGSEANDYAAARHGSSLVQNRGAWTAPDSPQLFADYVTFVVSNLSDLCDLWATVNEPVVLIGKGYLLGSIPPQIASVPGGGDGRMNLIRAHRLATSRIHDIQPPPPPGSPGRLRRGDGCGGDRDRGGAF